MMHAPKLLPWCARKAGVPLDRAEVLWRKAVRDTPAESGWVGSSDSGGAAMNAFMALLKAEQATLCAPRVTSLVRSQNWIWSLPLQAFEDMVQLASAYWHSLRPQLAPGQSTTRSP